jgi:hypothetical protein
MKNARYAALLLGSLILLAGCSPKVGSDAWCEKMQDKERGDWTMNEAADFARHCILR